MAWMAIHTLFIPSFDPFPCPFNLIWHIHICIHGQVRSFGIFGVQHTSNGKKKGLGKDNNMMIWFYHFILFWAPSSNLKYWIYGWYIFHMFIIFHTWPMTRDFQEWLLNVYMLN
jgi:hypothetical protein